MRILVENGRLLDPSRELDVQESLWIDFRKKKVKSTG